MERVQEIEFIDQSKPVEKKETRAIDRRGFLASVTGLAAITAMAPDAFARNFIDKYDPDGPIARYPNPDVIGFDKRFKYKLGNTPIIRHYRGTMWAEGCAWNQVGRYLIWSDIPANEQLRWIEEDGHVSRQFRFPSGNSNGNTFDFQGRQIAFEHGNRRVVRYEWDGSMTVLADKAGGKELNAPNDGAVTPDGSLFFTDPGYGGLMNYEGVRLNTGSPQPIQKEAVYRCDGPGKVEKVADEPFKPNGLCFSPDYKKCYIADTGLSHYSNAKSVIWVYDVDGKRLRNGRVFSSMEMDGKVGFADGIRCDEDGNVWAGMGWVGDGYDGVHVFAPDGVRIGMIRMPEIVSNVCFGGSKRNRLFMTGSTSLYSVFVETRGGTIT
ncbi:MAG TPA: SMP-30/gluconolactonase/LRE family protein [Burkholderiales bacterium]|jgi:gluconolactonase|nr:SMP-30/gluconolactonase/LRE family protein [Burkholderiales bacterium]